MKIGDKVLTHLGERGTIVSQWDHLDKFDHNSYDWWVEILFNWQGQERVSKEPYREKNLSLAENKNEKV